MGCNCKVTKNILRLHKDYGQRKYVKVSDKILFKLKETLRLVIILVLMIFCFPIILIWILIKVISGKNNFNINKNLSTILKKRKNE